MALRRDNERLAQQLLAAQQSGERLRLEPKPSPNPSPNPNPNPDPNPNPNQVGSVPPNWVTENRTSASGKSYKI